MNCQERDRKLNVHVRLHVSKSKSNIVYFIADYVCVTDSRASLASRTVFSIQYTPDDLRASLASRTALSTQYTPDDLKDKKMQLFCGIHLIEFIQSNNFHICSIF